MAQTQSFDKRFWTFGLAVLVGLGFYAYNDAHQSSSDASSVVTYSVDGTGRASTITYENTNGTSQLNDVPLPWSTTVYGVDQTMRSLVAQNGYTNSDITCSISGDGSNASNTSTGADTVVTCTG